MRLPTLTVLILMTAGTAAAEGQPVDYGPRPAFLIDKLPDGPLKDKLESCAGQTPQRSDFSIGHRGAPLQFPEHTLESNRAAARMGAGILECDVTFTRDLELVCRHAQNDLHRTTNILLTDLAETCVTPFTPATGEVPATAECRTSELTLAEFRTLTPKMDSADRTATTPEAYQGGLARWRTDLYSDGATLMTHADSIDLFKAFGTKFTPELKSPTVDMPFNGFSQEDYAQKLVDEYKAADIPPSNVWLQSFNLDDVLYWLRAEPEFGAQAVYLIDHYRQNGFNPMDAATWPAPLDSYKAQGVNYVAPPLWVLVTSENGKIVPSLWAREASAAGLSILTWTLERSGPLSQGGGWYFQTISDLTTHDGVTYEILDVLAQDVGVAGVFSDWPATVTYYANCMGL